MQFFQSVACRGKTPSTARCGWHLLGPMLAFALMVVARLAQAGDAPDTVPLQIPNLASLPAGEMGESIVRGRAYLAKTGELLPAFVGNGLTCKNCHLGNDTEVGVVANAAPFVGVVAGFPQYRSRDGAVNLLEQRINSCFERSMNGKPLPLDHPAMVDMVAYMTWLSQGVPVGSVVAGHGMPQLVLARDPDMAQGKGHLSGQVPRLSRSHGGGLGGVPMAAMSSHPCGVLNPLISPPAWHATSRPPASSSTRCPSARATA
jgi:thiosulfate dehydrogenase